eukprot:6199923-Pleurochrysis_carterae.AAC.1
MQRGTRAVSAVGICAAAESLLGKWVPHVLNRSLHIMRAIPMKAFLMIILPPLVLLPLLGIDEEEPDIGRTAYMMGIMAAYWTSEALPIAVTSLLPVVMLPLMGENSLQASKPLPS